MSVHDDARHECLESAAELGLHMSCADEDECPATDECGFFKEAYRQWLWNIGALP